MTSLYRIRKKKCPRTKENRGYLVALVFALRREPSGNGKESQ
jgi:hypothetical protein